MEDGERGRWALLVGIDRYPRLGAEVELEGCVNDVQILRDALIRRFGFTAERMTVLLNEEATRDAILAAMEDLVRKVGEDDVVVFHFSGHGSQWIDGPEADEPDGWDETLVPYDSGRPPVHKNRDIVDDEIYGWLSRLTAKTPYVTLIIDACHSGTIIRKDFGGKVRQVERDGRPRELAAGVAREAPPPPGPSGWLPIGRRYVLIAACANAETAQEILVGEGDPVRHGALTYFVVQELMNPDFTGGTYLDLFERLAPRVKAWSLSQTPQVEGARHREIFGVREIRPMRYLSVLSRSGEEVVLEGGAACGLTVGSEWDVYAPGTRAPEEGTPVGKVAVTAVGATRSAARVVEEPGAFAIQAGARAVETAHALEAGRLRVEIVAPPAGRRALEDFLLGSKGVTRARPGEPVDARIVLEAGDWKALLADGTSLLGPARYRSQDLEILRENLEHAARLRGIAGLRNDGSPLRRLVDFTLHRWEDGERRPPELDANGGPVFTAGDQVVLEIRNRSEHPLFLYVIDIGLTGRVSLIWPAEGAGEYLEGESTFHLGQDGELSPLCFPEDLARLPGEGRRGAREGRETLKLFVTRNPADFRVLFSEGFRFRTGPAKSLHECLEATFGGGKGVVCRSTEDEDWTTVEKSFLLRDRELTGEG